MTSLQTGSDNEMSFLRTIRKELGVDSETLRSRKDFPDIFASSNDQTILQCVSNRNTQDLQELVTSFKENGIPLKLNVHLAANLVEAADVIYDIARNTEPEFGTAKHIIQHAHPDIQELRLWERFSQDAISVHTTHQEDQEIRDKTTSSFIGITAADWGIAESATLVQVTAPGRPRSTSLVPSIHIGLLRQSRLLENISEAYAMLRQEAELSSVTLISGPSKTADIEAHMVHGAHGPREMHVIIFKDK